MNQDAIYRSVYAEHYRAVVRDAHSVVDRALAVLPSVARVAVAVSGGKDSTAMAHIVAQHCDPLFLWNDSGLELPESEDVVRCLAGMLSAPLVIAKGDALGVKRRKGRFVSERTAAQTDNEAIVCPVRKILSEHSILLEFVGLRESESRVRAITIRKHGPVHVDSKRWGCAIAWPMRRWSGEDSLAYLDEYGLPVHPAYLRTDWNGDRASIRVSWVWDSTRERHGDLEYMRRYYPSIWRQLTSDGLL